MTQIELDLDPIDTRELPTYLSRAELARRIGLKSVRSLSGMELPPHDAVIGPHKGWLASTVDEWHESRPGRGRWGARMGVLEGSPPERP